MLTKLDWLKTYIAKPGEEGEEKKHYIYPLTTDYILKSEKKIGFKFPTELKNFYMKFGCGFICDGYKSLINRFLGPGSLASCWLREDEYRDYSDNSPYRLIQEMKLFFAISCLQ